MLYFMTFLPSPPRAFVSILSRNSHKPLPRWVHRRSRGEGQYGRRSCGTLDIQSAFCEPGRLTIKIISIFFILNFDALGSHTNITLYPTPALLPPCH